ncbi:MAG: hypothetical protein O2782_02175 [bacterium]|nr:hypothetical protein [bacterium]
MQGHLTLLPGVGATLRAHDGTDQVLGGAAIHITAADTGWIEHRGWRLTMPAGSCCNWPVLPHNPYRKDGHATFEEARLVVSLPLNATASHSLVLTVL